MNFDKEIKPYHLLFPILCGLIAFLITVACLNYWLEWPEKALLVLPGKTTYYKPSDSILMGSSVNLNIADTLFTPFHHDNKFLFKSKQLVYNRFPLMLLWILSVGVLIGFGFSFIPLYVYKMAEYGFKWYYFFLAFIIVFGVFFPQLIGKKLGMNLIMPKDIEKVFGIGFSECALVANSVIPFIPVLFWIVTIISILESSFRNKGDLKKLTLHKLDFESFFIIIAISLGLSIFCNNIFNSSTNLLLQSTGTFKVLPNEFAYINAIIYSFVLIIAYLFINGYMRSLIEKSKSINKNIKEVTDNKKSFIEYLGIILTLLAPILGSGIADFVKFLNI